MSINIDLIKNLSLCGSIFETLGDNDNIDDDNSNYDDNNDTMMMMMMMTSITTKTTATTSSVIYQIHFKDSGLTIHILLIPALVLSLFRSLLFSNTKTSLFKPILGSLVNFAPIKLTHL